MKLKALKPMRYGGRRLLAGDVFEGKQHDCALLVAAKLVEVYFEPPPKRVAAVFKPSPTQVKTSPVILGDEQPGSQSFEDMVVSGAVAIEREPVKRAYKRRDMVSE